MGQVERRANLNPEIVARIAAAVDGKQTDLLTPNGVRDGRAARPAPPQVSGTLAPTDDDVSRVSGEQIRVLNPQAIFDYVYAILHTPEYRAKYREFLKTDFPQIPYPKDGEMFRRFAAIGAQLRTTHLMKDPMPTLAERTAAFPVAGNNVVETVRWDNGRVWINDTHSRKAVCRDAKKRQNAFLPQFVADLWYNMRHADDYQRFQ